MKILPSIDDAFLLIENEKIKDFGKIKTNFQINSLKLKPFLLKELNK